MAGKKINVLEQEDNFEITAMIDVVFLLLIYFMFLPIQQESDLGIRMPSEAPPDATVADELPSEVVIDVLPNRAIMLEGQLIDDVSSRNLPELVHALRRLKASADRIGAQFIVTIQADEYSPHQRSIDVLNACAEADVKIVSFGAGQ